MTVLPGLERKNTERMRQHLKTLKEDKRQREEEGNKDLAAACKEAGSWVWHRGRGRVMMGVGRCG